MRFRKLDYEGSKGFELVDKHSLSIISVRWSDDFVLRIRLK